ncbi:hypothetical protein [Corynebacterium tuberculostearicum]|uniref:hypothetical protein n=1 Tax=Corynebacterium tuberculostearicum TaxID=38304 RepID=UPI00265D0223|nr:hypothetical protein [Corynebacterium tuberculostearicum]WKE57681.1 hypothetical protein J8247_01795 [Corynebacterium tuberculostearicum]
MPVIQFDVLVPNAHAARVAEIFITATNKLVENGSLSSAEVTRPGNPQFPEGLEEQLRQNYRDEHEDRVLEDASVNRYDIAVEGVSGSINQLGMVLSRLLTPHAVLPKDHVLLEDELAHERPAIFPWSLSIRP